MKVRGAMSERRTTHGRRHYDAAPEHATRQPAGRRETDVTRPLGHAPRCQWFLDCHDESVAVVEHPTIGDVEICSAHLEWLTQDMTDGVPNPTRMVPPIAAKHGRRLREALS